MSDNSFQLLGEQMLRPSRCVQWAAGVVNPCEHEHLTRRRPRRDSVFLQPGTHRRLTGLEPMAGTARRAVDPPVDRRRVLVERVQEAPRRSAATSPARSVRCRSRSASSCSGFRRRSSAPGWTATGRAWRCSPRCAASAAAGWSARPGWRRGQYWLVLLGYGLLGGIGWGIGYISPVSTLIKWFPDKPGMATGLAIMGFGGGALIASPWSTAMLGAFGTDTAGIAKTFLVHGLVYAVFMSLGWLLVRVPRADWKPHGWTPAPPTAGSIVTGGQVSATNAIKTPQFWLLWVVLCFNVTAGIGILEKASPIYQDYFPTAGIAAAALAAAAAGYVAMLSLANMLGTHRLVQPVRRDRPQERLPDVPRRRRAAVPDHHADAELEQGGVPDLHAADPVVLRRRLRDRARLSTRPVRHLSGGGDPRPAAHRVVGRPASSGRSSSTPSPTARRPRARTAPPCTRCRSRS